MARPKKEDAIDIKGRAISESLSLLRDAPETLSLSVLARRIGCSAPALYAHFSGKSDLLEYVRERAFGEFENDPALRFDAPPGDSAYDRVRRTGRAFISYGRSNPALYRLIFAPDHVVAESRVDISEITTQPLTQAMAELLPHTDASDGAAFASLVWFSLHGAMMMALDQQMPGPESARWKRAEAVLDDAMAVLSNIEPKTLNATPGSGTEGRRGLGHHG